MSPHSPGTWSAAECPDLPLVWHLAAAVRGLKLLVCGGSMFSWVPQPVPSSSSLGSAQQQACDCTRPQVLPWSVASKPRTFRCLSLLLAHRSLPQAAQRPRRPPLTTCNSRETARSAGQAKLSAGMETESIPPILMQAAHHTHHPSRDTHRAGCWDALCPAGWGLPKRPTAVVTAPSPGGRLSGRAGLGEAGSDFREMRTIGMMRYRAFSM